MAKVSASTLVRRASKTKDKAVAKRLRAQAAKARREARADAKGIVTAVSRRDKKGRIASFRRAYDASLSDAGHQAIAEATGENPVETAVLAGVGSAMPDGAMTREAMDAAKFTEQLKTQIEAQHINVVCAFLAEMSAIATLNRGPLPRAVMVSGYTIARVVDALRQAGYTEDGKEGMKRYT